MKMTRQIVPRLALVACLASAPLLAHAALKGVIESADCSTVQGWAWNDARPNAALVLTVYDGKQKLANVSANRFRPDLRDQGNGKHGFVYRIPAVYSFRDGKPHTLQVRFADGKPLANGPKKTPICYAPLNDTGTMGCANAEDGNLVCPQADFPDQDGEVGRDAEARDGTLPKKGFGPAGFDYSKIANDGSELPDGALPGPEAKDWGCTRDNVTGLVWEIKTNDGGLRDKSKFYTWYVTDPATNGGFSGYQGVDYPDGYYGGHWCDSDVCNTTDYATAVNEVGLCGWHDWRLPTMHELLSLLMYDRTPALSVEAFPDMSPHFYPSQKVSSDVWSSVSSMDGTLAWIVGLNEGVVYSGYTDKYNTTIGIRLVRSAK